MLPNQGIFTKVKWDEVALLVDGAVKEILIISVKATAIYNTQSNSQKTIEPTIM
jgi:hypothetical protein